MKPRTFIIGLALIALSVGLPSFGEVSARLDEDGNYVGMSFRFGTQARIWSSPAPTLTRRPLNANGDILGDLAPTIVESPLSGRWPVAVWAHPNGPDYDLVFSRWTGRSWTPMAFSSNGNASASRVCSYSSRSAGSRSLGRSESVSERLKSR